MEKAAIAISNMLGSSNQDYFGSLHLMDEPVEPDKMTIEENYNIYEIRNPGTATKEKLDKFSNIIDGAAALLKIRSKMIRKTSVAKSLFFIKEQSPPTAKHMKSKKVGDLLDVIGNWLINRNCFKHPENVSNNDFHHEFFCLIQSCIKHHCKNQSRRKK